MRIRILTSVLVFISLAIQQVHAERYAALPARYDGSMMPYDFSRVTPPAWPDSLQPRFCAYVARHGARFMSSPKKFDKLESQLLRAKEDSRLTPDGYKFLKLIETVKRVTAGRWGELSPTGLQEERLIAAEMAGMLPGLNRADSIRTEASFVPRAIMTMYGFNHALALNNDSLHISAASGNEFSKLVYCFEYDKEYADYRKNGDWKEVVNEYEAKMLPVAPIERLMKTSSMSRKEIQGLTNQLYSVIQSLRAMGLAGPTTEWMTEDEYRACWLVSNLTHYLRNNVTPLSSVAARATAPLIEAIISGADASLAAGYEGPFFRGWFGHAETLLPLLSALQLPGCFALPLDYVNLDREWQLQDITPLGANLAIIILTGPSGKAYASVRLNGRNISPIKGEGLIVSWDALSAHWKHLVESVNNRLTAD